VPGQFVRFARARDANYYSFIHSFIQVISNSASSSPLLFAIPNTARTLCRSFTPMRHWQLRVKD